MSILVSLGCLLPTVEPSGESGVQASVDNKAVQAISGAAAQRSQDATAGQSDTGNLLAAEPGRQWSELGSELIGRMLDVQPTLTLRSGHRLRVLIRAESAGLPTLMSILTSFGCLIIGFTEST